MLLNSYTTIYMYKIIYTDLHPSLHGQVMWLSSTHSHNTRNPSLFTLTRYSKANINFCTLVQNLGMNFPYLVIANFVVLRDQSTNIISINIETIPPTSTSFIFQCLSFISGRKWFSLIDLFWMYYFYFRRCDHLMCLGSYGDGKVDCTQKKKRCFIPYVSHEDGIQNLFPNKRKLCLCLFT